MLQSLVEGFGALEPYGRDFKELIDLCFSCRRCVEICPAGIPIPDLMSYARYAYRKGNVEPLNLGQRVFANYGTFDLLGSAMAPLSNWALRNHQARRLLQRVVGIDERALLPRFQRESFDSWFSKRPNRLREKKVVYFTDSYANYNDPALAKTVVRLLEGLGYQVIVPPQKESGMPAIEYGLLEKARKLARYNTGSLASYAKQGIPVVCSSPAATHLLRQGYPNLMGGDDVISVSKGVVDISELLVRELEGGSLRFGAHPSQRVQYHYCCLSRALSLGKSTERLLSAAGFSYGILEDCCGGAGVWGTFANNYDLSGEIAAKLLHNIQPGSLVLTESETCKLQIESHGKVRTGFPLELLAHRASFAPPRP